MWISYVMRFLENSVEMYQMGPPIREGNIEGGAFSLGG